MLDPKKLRTEPETVATALLKRGFVLDTTQLQELEEQRKLLQASTQEMQAERNQRAKSVANAKAQGQDIEPLLREMSNLKTDLESVQTQLVEVQGRWDSLVHGIPNIPDDDVPQGRSEEDNVEVRRWGAPRKYDFEVKDHVDLGVFSGQLDLDTATKITGSRFSIMYGELAQLHRALIQFMLDVHTREHGYREVYVPYIVNSESLFGTGQLPKFETDLFKLQADQDFYLIPTAEVPVTNIYRERIAEATELPARLVCHTPCFRSEAGSYGKDTRGMIRQHQFEKVELVQFVTPQRSERALEELRRHAESILEKLELPYRTVILCGGDLGFSAARTYDIEVWLPSQAKYREISSCSNFRDFQARRLKARWRNPETGKPELLNTVNGSGLAVGRTLVAVMENYQQRNGNIVIPSALQSYMGGKTHIGNAVVDG